MKQSLLIFCLTLILPVSMVTAQKKLIIATPNIPSAAVMVSHEILKEAYQKAGLSLQVRRLPAKRSLIDANNGKYDGELTRVSNIEKLAPNLIQVPVAIYSTRLVVFTKDKEIHLKGWESLKPYKLGVLRGLAVTDQMTKEFETHAVNSPESLFKILNKNRVDFSVFLELDGLMILRKINLHTSIKPLSPPLIEVKLFHYLHKKNQDLVPKLTQILARMQASGALEALIKHSEAKALGEM